MLFITISGCASSDRTRFGFLSDAFADICRPIEEASNPLTDVELWALGSEDTYKKRIEKRFNCTNGWLHATSTPLQLSTSVTVLSAAVTLMSDFFERAVFGDGAEKGILPFVIPDKSPVAKCIRRYMDALRDRNCDFWLGIRGVDDWTQEQMVYAASETWRMIGNLWLRCFLPFLRWPWPLLGFDELPEDGQARVAGNLVHCKPEHMEPGVAKPVRNLHHTPESFIADKPLHKVFSKYGKSVEQSCIKPHKVI